MASWTLAEIMSKATQLVGYRDDIAQSEVSFWANEAYQQVALDAYQDGLEELEFTSVSSGESRLPKPIGMNVLLNLSLYSANTLGSESRTTLRKLSINEIDSQGHLPSGRPEGFAEYSNWIELWPSPNSGFSLQIRYTSEVTVGLVALGDVPSIATEWRRGILHLTESFLHRLVGNEEESISAEVRYVNFISSRRDSLAKRQQGRTPMKLSFAQRRTRRFGSN